MASHGSQSDVILPPDALCNVYLCNYVREQLGRSIFVIEEQFPLSVIKFTSPFSWSTSRKFRALSSTLVGALLAAASAGSYALAADGLIQDWKLSATQFNAGITLFVIAFGFAPILVAPLSETHGRYWVFVSAGAVFIAGTLGCAITRSYAGMMISRLVTGCGASIFATLTGGVVGDVFDKHERNTAMTLFTLVVLAGTGVGPLCSGIVAQYLHWRWIFYWQLIAVTLNTLAILCFFEETRANILLQRKCDAINHHLNNQPQYEEATRACSSPYNEPKKDEPGELATTLASQQLPNIRFYVQNENTKPLHMVLWQSFCFPLRLLGTELVVFLFSLWVSFAWAILYMQFSSVGIIFRRVYHFNNLRVGTVYIAVIIGSVLAACLSLLYGPIVRRFAPDRVASPVHRLYTVRFESILLPLGLFWLGWTAKENIPWIVPTIAVGACTMGIFSIYLAVFNYLVDAYGTCSSSTLAAQSMCRNLLAGLFPLFTERMINQLGIEHTGTMLGSIAILLTLIPWLLVVFDKRIRARSSLMQKFSSE